MIPRHFHGSTFGSVFNPASHSGEIADAFSVYLFPLKASISFSITGCFGYSSSHHQEEETFILYLPPPQSHPEQSGGKEESKVQGRCGLSRLSHSSSTSLPRRWSAVTMRSIPTPRRIAVVCALGMAQPVRP